MLTPRIRTAAAFAVLLTCAGVRGAHAQGAPIAEGAIGYAFLHDRDADLALPIGWTASIGGLATDWLALVGEVGGSYRTYTDGAADLSLRQHSFAAGPRLMVPATAPLAPYAQVLVGVAIGAIDVSGSGTSVVVRGTSFLSQLGLGVDLNASPRRALRLELALRALRRDEERADQWRFAAAFVFRS